MPNLLNKQQVFDTVANHLLTQMKRSTVNRGMWGNSCRYKNLDGLQCAVGCLILDELYDERIEGVSVIPNYYLYREEQLTESEIVLHDILSKVVHKNTLPLLKILQRVHDSVQPTEWEAKLLSIARHYNLKVRFQPKHSEQVSADVQKEAQ